MRKQIGRFMILVVLLTVLVTTVMDDLVFFLLNRLEKGNNYLLMGALLAGVVVIVMLIGVSLAKCLTKKVLEPVDEMAEHVEDTTYLPKYEELQPFMNRIRTQHDDILAASKSRQDFTASVSHELKTPLTAISGYAELIENGMAEPAQQAHFAQEIKKNADRLLGIIDDIISLSELDSSTSDITFEALDLFDLAKECCTTLEVVAAGHDVELVFEGEHCNVYGSRENLREVIFNLVQNAIKYNKAHGHVWVNVYIDNGPVLSVKDDGIGIPVEDQEKIFERFYRVDKSRSKATGGTGLGLSIVKHIVELHKATILLDSELGEGTEIRVVF